MLLRAPAGYAKTSVLAEWAEQDDRPFAWVSLTSRDDDATRLLNRLVEAVDGVSLKGRPFVLVVDNADVVRTKGASDALANVIASLRPDGQIALASRKEPQLPLGRMRAQREVFELTRRDLAMSRTESAALLEELGLTLSPEEADALHEQIEGWPAALYLAGLFLAHRSLIRRPFAADFAGDDQFVSDYFRDEFLLGDLPRSAQVPDPLVDPRRPRRTDLRRGARAIRVGTGPARAGPVESAPRPPRSQPTAPTATTRSSGRCSARSCTDVSPTSKPTSTAVRAPGTRSARDSRKPIDHAIAAGDEKRAAS